MKYQSNLRSKPSWLNTFDNEAVEYGFDETGMWFTGDASESESNYPIRTNFDIPQNSTTTVIFTFIHNEECADHGICFFNSNKTPTWLWGSNENRIAIQYNCGVPEIVNDNGGENDDEVAQDFELEIDETYTSKVTYDPINETIKVETYIGENTTGNLVNSIEMNDVLSSGDYRIGFSADQDEEGFKTYFTNLIIITDTNTTNCTPKICTEKIGMRCFSKLKCTCATSKYIQNGLVPAITVCNMSL